MIISAEEKLMYSVMKAIYESGIPMSFKGSMVLKACLIEAGFQEETRHTIDIDANWNSDTQPTIEQIRESVQRALDWRCENLSVEIIREYGVNRSAGFDIRDIVSDSIVFSMDIDVNRPIPSTKIYEIDGMIFRGVTPVQIIADKVFVLSTDVVLRRIKDIIDIYYISMVIPFDTAGVRFALEKSGRILGDFEALLSFRAELQHSYDKFRFDTSGNRPMFQEVYERVVDYIKPILVIK